jgi:hypothetical protein
MLTTPHKRFIYAREERFADFSEFSFFRTLLKRRRPQPERRVRSIVSEPAAVRDKRWKPSAWTPWLWMK